MTVRKKIVEESLAKKVLVGDFSKFKSNKKKVSPADIFYKQLKSSALVLHDELFSENDFVIDVTKIIISRSDYDTLRNNYKSWIKRFWKPYKLEMTLAVSELQEFPCVLSDATEELGITLADGEVALLKNWLVPRDNKTWHDASF